MFSLDSIKIENFIHTVSEIDDVLLSNRRQQSVQKAFQS